MSGRALTRRAVVLLCLPALALGVASCITPAEPPPIVPEVIDRVSVDELFSPGNRFAAQLPGRTLEITGVVVRSRVRRDGTPSVSLGSPSNPRMQSGFVLDDSVDLGSLKVGSTVTLRCTIGERALWRSPCVVRERSGS